jgi:hypothetical protein
LARDCQPSRRRGRDGAHRRSLVVEPRYQANRSNAKIRDALAQASAYLTTHPNEARYTDSAATAVLESGLAVTVQGPNGASVATDMPKSVGGGDGAPSPGWLLRAAQAGCLATLIALRAAQQGIDLDRIEVIVDSESDDLEFSVSTSRFPPAR